MFGTHSRLFGAPRLGESAAPCPGRTGNHYLSVSTGTSTTPGRLQVLSHSILAAYLGGRRCFHSHLLIQKLTFLEDESAPKLGRKPF